MAAAINSIRETKPTQFVEYSAYLELMRRTLGRSCAHNEPKHWRNSLKLIADFAHQGPRSFLMFLSDLQIDWRGDFLVVERIFGREAANGYADPHNLLRLYITNNRKRYAQASGHFPNMFLVDATYAADDSFPAAAVSHGHTYWLKYLLLKFISSETTTSSSVVSLNAILDVFRGSYPEKLVRLVLGSLASTETSGCIEVVESLDSQVVRVRPTLRGTRIVGNQSDRREWCFSWDYLQFVVDDYQLALPRFLWTKIYISDSGLGYLLRQVGPYAAELSRDVTSKGKSCIYFLHVLEAAKNAEVRNRLKGNSVLQALMPDFREIYQNFFSELKHISEHIRDGVDFITQIEYLHKELSTNAEIASFFIDYGDDDHFIVEPA